MRYKFVGTLLVLGGCFLSAPNMYAATRCRKQECIQPKPCPPPRKCPPRVFDPCENRIGKGPSYADCDLKPAYSGPARINPHCAWDVNLEASFIYWHVSQEGMDFARYSNGAIPEPTSGSVFQKFDFKPGFKVAAGSYLWTDDWTGKVEYTRLHFTNDTYTYAPENGILFPNIYTGNFSINGPETHTAASQAKSKWECNQDIIDLRMARWFYSGKMLTMSPFLGARGGWINQRFNLSYIPINQTEFSRAKHRSKSWFIGPRTGLDMHWILGYGLKATGSVAGSLLYQRQRATSNIEIVDGSDTVLSKFENTFRHLRSNTEFALGIMWGTYLLQDRLHMNVGASYNFQNFSGQNVMRSNLQIIDGDFSPPGNLNEHGFEITGRIDF